MAREVREDVRDTVNSYITDMLALEEHIEKALSGQIKDFDEEYPRITAQLRSIHARCEQHIRGLKFLTEERGGAGTGFTEAIKRAAAAIAGLGAAGVELLRTGKLPKDLRDDYTALNLAAIGYTMLFTTARSLDEDRVAELAERHLRDYADALMTLHDAIPGAVVEFLQRDGLPARAVVLPDVANTVEDIWRGVSTPTGDERWIEVERVVSTIVT